tara:strand:+ start:9412 stop:9966 length:555 start_codon:yes stop_codon:yes gene_type:complete
MQSKNSLRKKYFQLRKKKYFEINPSFFIPLEKLIRKKFTKNKMKLACYYPSSFEVNILKIFELEFFLKLKTFLPVVQNNKFMYFKKWKKNDILQINKFGMLEPKLFSKNTVPNIMLVPLLAYDMYKNRLGYGGGFYDRYLNKFLKKNNNILTIGIAFSFQKYNKLPQSNNDVKLKYILTEKGLV